MTGPRFSVIVPVYNAAPYLSACAASVLRQAGDDYELLLYDDGSSDGGGALCDELAAAHSGVVRVFHQENAGLLTTRRRALAEARGEYILFLDADDSLTADALARLRAVLDRYAPDIILYKWARTEADGITRVYEQPDLFPEGRISREELVRTMARTEALNSLCLKLIRRTLYDTAADYASYAAVTNGEDLLQSLPPALAAESVYFLPAVLYLYRTNTASMTWRSARGLLLYLTLVRPRLREAMDRLSLRDEATLREFHRVSLTRTWTLLEDAARRGADEGLDLLSREPLLAEAAPYLRDAGFSRFRQAVLRLFLAHRVRTALGLLRLRNRLMAGSP